MKSIFRILRALRMALWGHRKQKDQAGQPYWHHLLVVAWTAYGLTRDPEAVVVGLLHDYLEDVDDPEASKRLYHAFGGDTSRRLRWLTRNEDEDYENYIGMLALNADDITLAVKIADLLHNTDPKRRGTRSRAWKYQRALQLLTRRRTGLGVQP